MDKVLIYSIIFSFIKILLITLWFFFGVFLIKLGLKQNDKDPAYTMTEYAGKYYKYNKFKLLIFILFTISIVSYFNIETAHRTKTNMNESSKGSPEMMSYEEPKEIVKENKPDYQKMLDDHRKENEKVKEEFNSLN
jgi:amino acid permease